MAILQKIEKDLIFILILEKLLLCKYSSFSPRKCQALAGLAAQNRNLYFKIDLKYIAGNVQIGWDLST